MAFVNLCELDEQVVKLNCLREHPSENHAVLKCESSSTLSDFVQILFRVT